MSAAAAISIADERPELLGELRALDDRVLAHLALLPEPMQQAFAKHLAEQVAAQLFASNPSTPSGRRLAAVPDQPAVDQREVSPGPHDLLTIKQVLAIPRYQALGGRWLRENAPGCGATRKGGKRSALLFTRAGIDAELRRRQSGADNKGVSPAEVTPIVRGPKTPKSGVTPNGNPRSFAIRAPGKAA